MAAALMTKRKRIKLYFDGSKWTVSLVLVGLISLPLLVGFLILPIGLYRWWKHAKNMPSDVQVDEWAKEDLLDLSDRALQKFGVDKTQIVKGPIFVLGWPELKDLTVAGFRHKKGKDKRIRLSPFSVNVICTGSTQIFSYSCCFDMRTGNPLHENTNELFLKDVVSVSTSTESSLINLPGVGLVQANTNQVFTVITSGGTGVRSVLTCPEVIQRLGGKDFQFPLSDADRAIAEIRNEVRLRKIAS